jgi:hypothetical protein
MLAADDDDDETHRITDYHSEIGSILTLKIKI